MPLIFQKNASASTRLAIWKIEEDESFFLGKVGLQQPIHHPHKRRQHLAGRYLLSLLFPDFPYSEIAVNASGKPFLPSGRFLFSISHCGDYAAAIVSTEKVAGIDIEAFSAKTEKVKFKFLGPSELNYLQTRQSSREEPEPYYLFTLCWCIKEAVYKWWGNGKIDFRKHIVIREFDEDQNTATVLFHKPPVSATLTLHIISFPHLALAWTGG